VAEPKPADLVLSGEKFLSGRDWDAYLERIR
jgi:hypothetical protein